jgi:hypothetical protein
MTPSFEECAAALKNLTVYFNNGLQADIHNHYLITRPTEVQMKEYEKPNNLKETEVSLFQGWRAMFWYVPHFRLKTGEEIWLHHFLSPPTTEEGEGVKYDALKQKLSEGALLFDNKSGQQILVPERRDANIKFMDQDKVRTIALKDINASTLSFVPRGDTPPADFINMKNSEVAKIAGIPQLQTTTQLHRLKDILKDHALKPIEDEEVFRAGMKCIISDRNYMCEPGVYLERPAKIYWGKDYSPTQKIRIVVNAKVLDHSTFYINQDYSHGNRNEGTIYSEDHESVVRHLWAAGRFPQVIPQGEYVFKTKISVDYIDEILVVDASTRDKVIQVLKSEFSNTDQLDAWIAKVKIKP